MEAQQYRLHADELFRDIEDKLESEDPDVIEAIPGDGFVSIEFGDKTKFIVSRQSATQQIWLAAGARAWHYDFDPQHAKWVDDRDRHEFRGRLSELISQKLGRPIQF
jgi:CyaY protein